MTAMSIFIKQSRMNKGFTQSELAAKLGYNSSQFLSNVERGLSPFPLTRFKQFIRFTGADRRALVEAYAEDARLAAKKAAGL